MIALPLLDLKAQETPVPGFAELAQRARQARNDNQFDQAINLYRAALGQRKSWVEGWWDLGSIQYKLSRYSSAFDSFQQVTVLNPKSGAAFAYMGLCDYALGRYTAALKNLGTGGNLGFGDNKALTPLILYRIALLLTRAGDFERSQDQLALFVAAGNHDPEIVEALGLSTLRMRRIPTEIPSGKHILITKAGEAAWEFDAHNVENAKKLFEELVAAYPKEPNVHYAYGMYLQESDPQLAFEEFTKELEISPSHSAARLQVAFFDLQQGSPEQAMKLAREVSKADANDYRVHLVIGRSYLQMNQPGKAVPELKVSAALLPEDYESRFYLAQAYRNLGKKDAAAREQAAFDRLKQEDKRQTSISGWWYFAGQYYQKGRFMEARDAFHKITDQSAADGAAWAMLGLCDFELADYANALEHLSKANRFGLQSAAEMGSAMHYYLAILLNRAGKFEDAKRQLSWFATAPSVNEQITEATGINGLRMTVLPAEIPAGEHDFVMQAGKATWALNLGQVEEAKSLFRELAVTHPDNPNIHYGYGICLSQSNDPEGALHEFQRVLEIAPAFGDAESQIVFLHLKQGLRDQALLEAENAVKMDPDSFLAYNALGWALFAHRQFDKAIGAMATAVRLAPDTPFTHYSLAQAYKAAGKDTAAQKEMAMFDNLNQGHRVNAGQTAPR